MTIRRPLVNSTCATSSGLSYTQFFISSRVSAHWVPLFSGRLANGQVSAFRCFKNLIHAPPALPDRNRSPYAW